MASIRTSTGVHGRAHTEMAALAGLFFALKPMITLVAVKALGLSAQAGSGLRLGATFMLCGLTVVATFDGASQSKLWSAPVKWAWAFLALAGCSLAWGESASPLVSAAYWLGTACELGMALLLMRGPAVEQTAVAMMKGFVAGALIVACTAWVMPEQYDLRLGDEDYFNANNIAYVCAFATFFVQYLTRRQQGCWGCVLLLLTVTILRSLSKTTIAAFFVSEACLLVKDDSIQRKTKAIMVGSALLLLVVFSGLFVAYFDIYTSYGNQSGTLTGRTAIWGWAFSEGLERPWFGHGFDALWKVAPVFGTFEARHAENEVLQQFYAFGIAGIVVLVGCYVSLWRAIRKEVHDPHRMIWSALMIFVVIRGLAEAEPFDLLLPLWMVALLASVITARAATVQRTMLVCSRIAAPSANVIGL